MIKIGQAKKQIRCELDVKHVFWVIDLFKHGSVVSVQW